MLDFGFYNMDCMEGMKEFPDKYFDLAIVDPPYGIGESGKKKTRVVVNWLLQKIINRLLEMICIKDGYNMVDGGDNNIMFVDSVKKKHSERMRSKETRSKISRSMKQYRKEHPFTEEHRRKLSEKASQRVYKSAKKVKKTRSGNIEVKRGDTRSIGCYCITSNGDRFDFHSYRDAWNWWRTIENPFDTDAECIYQRKIKQSIDLGYFTYGRNKVKYEYPKWYRGGDLDDKKVTNP